MRFQCRRKW